MVYTMIAIALGVKSSLVATIFVVVTIVLRLCYSYEYARHPNKRLVFSKPLFYGGIIGVLVGMIVVIY